MQDQPAILQALHDPNEMQMQDLIVTKLHHQLCTMMFQHLSACGAMRSMTTLHMLLS